MSEMPALILALLAGGLLGGIFFGGLWWTIHRGFSSKQPGLWFSGSLLLRTVITVTGFYFVAHGDWQRLVSSLLGFILARIVVTYFTRASIEERTALVKEGAS